MMEAQRCISPGSVKTQFKSKTQNEASSEMLHMCDQTSSSTPHGAEDVSNGAMEQE